MKDLGKSSANRMVLAFLAAEIDSRTRREQYEACLSSLGYTRKYLIDEGDLADPNANRQRAFLLGCVRGYPGHALFSNFPADTEWRTAELASTDLDRLIF